MGLDIRRKFVYYSLVIFLLPFWVVSFYFYQLVEKSLEFSSLKHLDSISTIYKSKIGLVLEEYFNDTKSIIFNDSFKSLVSNYKINDIEISGRINSIFEDYKNLNSHINKISLLNNVGDVMESSDKGDIAKNYFTSRIYDLNRNDLIVFDYFKPENGKYLLKLFGPVNINNSKAAVLMVEFNAKDLFDVVNTDEGLGDTGEIVTAERNVNGDARVIAPLRFDYIGDYNRVINKDSLKEPMVKALSNKEGIYKEDVFDYRGIPVLAVTRHIDIADWGMVVKMDRKEFSDSTVRMKIVFFVITLGVSIFISLMINYISYEITQSCIAGKKRNSAVRRR